jgi:hypothetical protein
MLDVDHDLLLAFENQLNPADPQSGSIPVEILGYGEVSTTLAIGGMDGLAFKRMPPFPDEGAAAAYRQAVDEYCATLTETGVRVVEHDFASLVNADGEHIVYLVQPRLEAKTIGNARLQEATADEFARMLTLILRIMADLWRKNRRNEPDESFGLDSQISNWVFTDAVLAGKERPPYLDVSTPLYRRNGQEMLDTEIFLKSAPSFLIGIIRRFFIQDVLDRYYDVRAVTIDVIANLYKEGRPDRIPLALETANRFFADEASDLAVEPLTHSEIDAYYREDKFIWSFLLAARRADRFIKTRLLGRKYNFILPGPVKR